MSILDYIIGTSGLARRRYGAKSGKIIDDEGNIIDLTKIIKTVFDADNGRLKISVQDPLESNGAIPVNIQDQHSHTVGALLSQAKGSPQSLAVATTVGSYVIEVGAGHSFLAGDEILMAEDDISFHAMVLSVSGDELTLNAPVDSVYTTSAIVFEVISNMNVNGSSAVQEFSVELGSGATISLDITGIRFVITDATVMDDGKFGGGVALTRGIVFVLEHTDGTHNLFTARTNGKLGLVMNNKEYTEKAPAGQYSLNCTWAIRDELGVTLRMLPGDKLKMLIQDDLTGLLTFKAWVYGHHVTD